MVKYPILVLVLIFFTSLGFSITINSLLLKFVKTLGIRNKGEAVIRWSSTSKPALGGITFFIVFLFSFTVFSYLKGLQPDFNYQGLGLLIAVSVGFLLGLFDDAYNTRPWLKLFTQIFCGIILIISGIHIELFGQQWINYALTIFWVVGIMNSINMLDNMDGITTIVSIGILLAMMAIIILRQDFYNPLLVIILGCIATLSGFLFFNWNPSKMFMGDTGSQFLGVLLAALAIVFFWNGDYINGEKNQIMQLTMVAMAFCLPIIDTTTVFIKRISKGSSPFIGGKDHTTHHLSYLGFSDRQVAWIFAVLSGFSVIMTVFMSIFIVSWKTTHLIMFWMYFLLLFVFLFTIAFRTHAAQP